MRGGVWVKIIVRIICSCLRNVGCGLRIIGLIGLRDGGGRCFSFWVILPCVVLVSVAALMVSEDEGSKCWVFLFLALSSKVEASNLTNKRSTICFARSTCR